MPAFSSHLQKHLARSHGHSAQLRRHRRRGTAAERAHVPRGEVRITHDHRDGVKRNPQFFGHSLRERSANVLSDLHFSRKCLHLAVSRNLQPRAYILRKLMSAESPSRFLRSCARRAEADKQPTAEQLQKVAALNTEAARRSPVFFLERLKIRLIARDHRVPPLAARCAARFTASTIRGWVPHRQTFPFIAVTICSSLGFGVLLSNEVALRIMPEVQ